MPKKSTFTGITSVPSTYFFDVFGPGFNYRISKANLFQQITNELGTPGVQSINDLSGALQLIDGTNVSIAINQAEGTFTFNSSLSPTDMQSITFDTDAGVAVSEGQMAWNDVDKTLDLGLTDGVVLQMGQEFVLRVLNTTGSTLVDGEAVYISGAQGNRTVVTRAQANSSTADLTIGIVTQAILNNQEGFVTISGLVRGFDTSAWSEGDELWLSEAVLGGITNVKPAPPDHAVHIGFVIRSSSTVGSIFVRVLAEESISDLHDVVLTSESDGDLISYDGGTQTWVNGQPESFRIVTTDGGQTITSPVFGLNGVDYTWPGADGSNGQALTTDGAGTLTWEFRVSTVSGSDNITITGGVQNPTVNLDSSQTHTTFDLNTTDEIGTASTITAGGSGVLSWSYDGVDVSAAAFGGTRVAQPVLSLGSTSELIAALGSTSGLSWVDDSTNGPFDGISGQLFCVSGAFDGAPLAGARLSFGSNEATSDSGVIVPRSCQFVMATLMATGLDGTLTLALEIDQVAQSAAHDLSVTGTVTNESDIVDVASTPLAVSSGQQVNYEVTAAPTTAGAINVVLWFVFD